MRVAFLADTFVVQLVCLNSPSGTSARKKLIFPIGIPLGSIYTPQRRVEIRLCPESLVQEVTVALVGELHAIMHLELLLYRGRVARKITPAPSKQFQVFHRCLLTGIGAARNVTWGRAPTAAEVVNALVKVLLALTLNWICLCRGRVAGVFGTLQSGPSQKISYRSMYLTSTGTANSYRSMYLTITGTAIPGVLYALVTQEEA